MKLTPAQIRYFLAVYALSGSGGVRSADVADSLAVTRPSVHRMMQQLTALGLLEKERYSSVRLTQEGFALAGRYLAGLHIIKSLLSQSLSLSQASAEEGALAVLGGFDIAELDSLCTRGLARG